MGFLAGVLGSRRRGTGGGRAALRGGRRPRRLDRPAAAPNAAHSDGPLGSLVAARDAIRRLKRSGPLPAGGVVVELAAGTYEIAGPLDLAAEDSGTAESPIEYRAAPGAEVRLLGGRIVKGWKPVIDPAVLGRLDPAARGQVLQADLKAQGISDLGTIKPGPTWGQSEPGLELFFRDEPMTLARWPNEGFVRIPAVLGPTPVDVRGTKGCREGLFAFEGDRPRRWVGEPDIMLEGFWFWDWADQRLRVQSIDTDKRMITLESKPEHHFGFRKGQWYYAYNLLSELDRPGQWYLDRQTGVLYFWPPGPIDAGRPTVSLLPRLATLKDVAHVTLRGLTIECFRGTPLIVSGGHHVRLAGCVFRNLGGSAVTMSGTESGVIGCDIYNVADSGVSINGGDRPRSSRPGCTWRTATSGISAAGTRSTSRPCRCGGVGNRVAHNLIHDAPHMAIGFSGNDHVIELNEIHSVVYQSNDAGVMYAGYNPTMRGHEIRYNYIHHIYGFEGRGCVGVYLDDMFCSAHIHGNIFYKVPRAAFIGGGRDNTVENNVFVDCSPAVHVDARALGWAAAGVELLKKRLREMPYDREPWRSRFPQLAAYLDDEPAVPKGNVVARNVCWGGKWEDVEKKARPYVAFRDNLVEGDPRLVGGEALRREAGAAAPAPRVSRLRRLAGLEAGLPGDSRGKDRAVRQPEPRHVARAARRPPAAGGTPGKAEAGIWANKLGGGRQKALLAIKGLAR